MSKHALWQLYGYMGNTAKLSKKTFFSMHFHPPQKKKKGEGDVFKGLCWCSDVMFDWLRFGFKRMSAHRKNNVFNSFMWGSKRIIYKTSIQTVKQTFALTLVCIHNQEITFFFFAEKTNKQQNNKIHKSLDQCGLKTTHKLVSHLLSLFIWGRKGLRLCGNNGA